MTYLNKLNFILHSVFSEFFFAIINAFLEISIPTPFEFFNSLNKTN